MLLERDSVSPSRTNNPPKDKVYGRDLGRTIRKEVVSEVSDRYCRATSSVLTMLDQVS